MDFAHPVQRWDISFIAILQYIEWFRFKFFGVLLLNMKHISFLNFAQTNWVEMFRQWLKKTLMVVHNSPYRVFTKWPHRHRHTECLFKFIFLSSKTNWTRNVSLRPYLGPQISQTEMSETTFGDIFLNHKHN